MKSRKSLSVLLTGIMLAGMLSGCGNSGASVSEGTTSAASTIVGENGAAGEGGVIDLEVWTTNTGFLPVEKGSTMYNFYKDLLGVGVIQPYVEWNGGQTYSEQLNLKIVAGEMPDVIQFVSNMGMENGLAKEGGLLDLTDYLPKYAPHLWELIPEETWDVMRSYDPNGEGRIYMTPNVLDYTRHSALIRQDWLDTLGLEMPQTQDEFVKVLRAFKTQDPNGNGVADEIPSGGRAEARWMDYLFSMYGIAMWEGYPEWDIYDGELTYSAVSPNMRDALEFISGLYQEGLLDAETLMNDKATWDGKINAGQVGVFFQWAEQSYVYATNIYNATDIQADWSVMPAISAEGYDAFYTKKPTMGAQFGVKNMKDPARIEAALKVLDAFGTEELWDTLYLGPEGMNSEKDASGVLIKSPEDKTTQQNQVIKPSDSIANADSVVHILELTSNEQDKWAVDKAIMNVREAQQYGKRIAGDGIPAHIYSGYDDIQNRTLYVEYASKIIAGEWPIEKFDEFVETWYATGGQEVTQAARDWYDMTQN